MVFTKWLIIIILLFGFAYFMYTWGYSDGYDAGFDEGFKDGYSDGFEDGYPIGHKVGDNNDIRRSDKTV